MRWPAPRRSSSPAASNDETLPFRASTPKVSTGRFFGQSWIFDRKPFWVYGRISLKDGGFSANQAKSQRVFSMDKEKTKIIIKEADKVITQVIEAFAQAMTTSPNEKLGVKKRIQGWTSKRRAQFARELKRAPNEQFQETLSRIESMQSEMRKVFMKVAKSFPKAKGGRPQKLNPIMRQRAISHIASLLPTHNLNAAIQIVADLYQVKPRYLQTIWQQRTSTPEPDTRKRRENNIATKN